MNSSPSSTATPDASRQTLYFDLIDQLLRCPNGTEPEVLDAHMELVDEGFVRSLIQVATYFSHESNADAARFLVHVARELAKQMGLYPDMSGVEPE